VRHERTHVAGNIKFDFEPSPEPECGALGPRDQRLVWVAGSTHEGESMVLDAPPRARAVPDALLLLVPRHPPRFGAVRTPAAGRIPGDPSWGHTIGPEVAVMLGDSMGELTGSIPQPRGFRWWQLVPVGATPLEPAAIGKPV
jgi:3-deoxy-D-manno-octulosonic-acid transferase